MITTSNVVPEFLLSPTLAPLWTWLAGPSISPSWMSMNGPPCEEGSLCWEPSRVIFASAVFHGLQCLLLACVFSLFSFYRRLSFTDRIAWLSYAVSTSHSMLASAGAVYSVLISDCYKESLCGTRCQLAELSVAFSVGYFYYDFIQMMLFARSLYSHVFLVHHFLGAFMGSLTFVIPSCQYVSPFFLLVELSTPFVNMRWFLDKCGLRSHLLYIINGVLMILVFFVARIVLTSYFLFEALVLHPDQYHTLPTPWLVSLMSSVVLLAAINIMWFGKMIRGLLRTLKGTRDVVTVGLDAKQKEN